MKREGIPWRGNLVSINLTQQPELGWGQLMPFVLLNYSSLSFFAKTKHIPIEFWHRIACYPKHSQSSLDFRAISHETIIY